MKSPKLFPIIAGSVIFALALCRSVLAHPHMWIDLKTDVIFGRDRQDRRHLPEWLFDDFYSTALLEDAAKHPDGSEQGLHEEISAILSGLHSWNYFTQITVDTTEITAKKVQYFKTAVRENRVCELYNLSGNTCSRRHKISATQFLTRLTILKCIILKRRLSGFAVMSQQGARDLSP